VEKLTKALEGAYISEGLSQSLANKYSTTTAVKAMTQNCSIDKVKLIMQAGTFTNMNDAISKFVNSCRRGNSNQGNNNNYVRMASKKYVGKLTDPLRKQSINAKVYSINYSLNIFVTFYNHSTENKLTFLIDIGADISLLKLIPMTLKLRMKK